MSKKLTLKDVKIIGEGPQIRNLICEKYGSLQEFYDQHKVTKSYITLSNYLCRQYITSDTFKLNLTKVFNKSFPSLFKTAKEQIESHVQNIYDNIREYDQESDHQTFDYLLKLCKEEKMTIETAMMYRAKARNYFYINKMNYCIEFYEYSINAIPIEDINKIVFFHCELAYDLVSENILDEADKKYKHIENLVHLHKDKLDNNTLYYYYYRRGIALMSNDKNEAARVFFTTAADYARKNYEKVAAIANIGLTHKKQKEYDEALEYYENALEYYDEARVLTTASIYNNMAELYKCKKDYPNALINIQKALEISEKTNDLGKQIKYVATQAEIKMKMGNKGAYEKYFDLLLSTKGKQIFKPDVLNDIKAFVKVINNIPCLEEFADIIIELKNASISDGYTKGLFDCLGHIMDKIRSLSKGGRNEKTK